MSSSIKNLYYFSYYQFYLIILWSKNGYLRRGAIKQGMRPWHGRLFSNLRMILLAPNNPSLNNWTALLNVLLVSVTAVLTNNNLSCSIWQLSIAMVTVGVRASILCRLSLNEQQMEAFRFVKVHQCSLGLA